MIGDNPSCSGTITGTTISISSCLFNQASLQLTILYTLGSGSDSTSSVTLTITTFKNPISTQAKTGFQIFTQDSSGNQIEQSSNLTLSGITTPASFTSQVLSLVDSTMVQSYTGIQIKLSLSVPLEQTCFLKFTFPQDFTVDDKLTQISGSGFFRPSLTSNTISWISKDSATRTIIIQACQIQFGPAQTGIITFSQIQNPVSLIHLIFQPQVKATGGIQIQLSKDSTFSINIAQITSSNNFIAPASMFTSGSVYNIQASTVDSNLIQTETNYTISFFTQNSLPSSGAIIIIHFPSWITLSSTGCAITAKSSSFSSSQIACSISSQNVTITNPFSSTLAGGTQLSITISKGTNPQSERDAGQFVIYTYIQISGVNYIVDQGTQTASSIKPVGGSIFKSADITVNEPITYMDDQTYSFYVQLQHSIPSRGYLNFTLPSEISISSESLIKSSCERLDTGKNLNCRAVDSSQILITFDNNGFSNQNILQFSVAGIKNPRSTKPSSLFVFNSWDSDFYRIDSSTSNDYFIATVSEPSEITSVTVENADKTNSQTTNYTFSIVPNTPIQEKDQIQIQFPPEVTLPDLSDLVCSPDSSQTSNGLIEVSCSKLSADTLNVVFSKSNNINAGQVFTFIVQNVKNPLSTKPSSPFSNIIMSQSVGNYLISRYDKNDIIVTNNVSNVISVKRLTQSNKNPSEEAIYTITFTTPNVLMTTASILITAPSIITVSNDVSACYVALTQVVQNVCSIDKNLIRIENAFAGLTDSYFGEVSIIFKAINPGDNSNLQSIILRIFTDNTYQYRVNKIETGLVPLLECNYPCRRCDQNNPDFCTDCFTQITFPQLIQPTVSGQTCVYKCFSGYTSNGSKDPKKCQKCDQKCEDCYQNDKVGDTQKCSSCSTNYPFYYGANITCQKNCYETQYECKLKECCDCNFPCRTCIGPATCKSCHTNSSNPLLWIDKCLSSCPTGFTAVGFNCVKCTSPCATCERGVPTSCLTCDMKQGKQLLFGRTCLSECPEGTTAVISNTTQSRCQGCVSGCESCDSDNNAICLKCDNGLALYKGECYTTCPFNYIKSRDGSTCELRTYLLDENLVYFPFGIAAAAVVIINFAAFCISRRKSMIISNSIAFLGVVEWAALLYQTYYSYMNAINYQIITISSFSVFCGLYAFNLFFVLFYFIRIQSQDIGFNYWRQRYFCTTILVLLLSLLINFKLFRLLYSRFLGIERFSAAVDEKKLFARRIQLITIISIFTFTLPLIVIDVLVLYYLEWGSQLYITCFESGGIAFVGAAFTILDNCCMCSRLSYFEEREIAKKKRKEKEAVYKQIDQSKSQIDIMVNSGIPEDYEDDFTRRQIMERKDALKEIVSQIKNNKKFGISQINFLVSEESQESQETNPFYKVRRTNSMQNLNIKTPEELQGEDDRKIQSFPGSPKQHKEHLICNETAMYKFDQENILKTSINKRKYKQLQIASTIQQEFKYDNVYAETYPPPPEPEPVYVPQLIESEIQTDTTIPPFKNPTHAKLKRDTSSGKIIGDHQAELLNDNENDMPMTRRKKKKRQRGKNKNPYYTQINEEDNEDQLSLGDEDTQREFLKTAYEQDDEDEDEEDFKEGEGKKTRRKRSDQEGLADMRNESKKKLQLVLSSDQIKQNDQMSPKKRSEKTIVSKSTGSNNIKDQENESQQSDNNIPKSPIRASQKRLLDLAQNQIEQEYFNQRTFNINDIIGEFVRNLKGGILNRKEQLSENNYRDMKGRLVNYRGYLINEDIGCIINKDNLNLMFRREELTEDGDIPMPFKFEKFNFNPHEVFGHFDFDKKTDKPIILKNKQGQLVDKHLRPVNLSGFLIDELGNIVDNQGKIKFVKEQLNEIGDIPQLFNYKGKQFDIRDIIGTFAKDPMTKQIIFNKDPSDGSTLIDKNNRKVNSAGYLVDRMGNIVNKNDRIVFFKSQLMFNEPPKLFPFMRFKLESIKGNLLYDQLGVPQFSNYHKLENGQVIFYDMDGRLVNGSGYLIDGEGNVIDQYGHLVFKKDILEYDENRKQSEIPLVFKLGVFDKNQDQFMEENQDQPMNIFEQNLINQQDEQQVDVMMQQMDQVSNLQENEVSNTIFQDPAQMTQQNETTGFSQFRDQIIDLEIKTGAATTQNFFGQPSFMADQQTQQPFLKSSDNDGEDQSNIENLLSDPEPLMNKINEKALEQKKPQKRKQSANPRAVKKHRQGDKVIQAYNASRPISSYLPQQYQQRAKSQVRDRPPLPNHESMQVKDHKGEYPLSNQFSNLKNQQTRLPNSISGMNLTSNLQSTSDIFRKNAVSALGFNEELNGTYQFPEVKRNQFMVNNNNEASDHSYSAYLEGDVDNQNFYHPQNLNQNSVSDHSRSQIRIVPTKHQRIKQNESMVEKLYNDEVNKYLDQSDDDPDGSEAIFNENFNLGRKHQNDQRSSSNLRRRKPNLKMYESGQRLDSSHSSDSQISRKGPAYLHRNRHQMKKNDSKLKNLEHIYLQEYSAKNSTMKKGQFNQTQGSKKAKTKYGTLKGVEGYRRDISPMEDRFYPQEYQQMGRHRINSPDAM